MPTEEYDDDDDRGLVEAVEEADDFEDHDDSDSVEVADVENQGKDGRRQLSRGMMSRFSDKLTGGAARPGEEEVKRSPFVMVLTGSIIGLALVALVFGIMILSASEQRSYDAAADKLKAKKYSEAEKKYEVFLENYSQSDLAEAARIGLHTSRVRMYTAKDSYSPDAVEEGMKQLTEMIRVCRDLPLFKDERERVGSYAKQLARAGAIVAKSKRLQEPLEHSHAAVEIMAQYAGTEGVPISVSDQIRRMQNDAAAEILKHGVLVGALAEIKAHLESGDTLAALESRQSLIDSYPVLSNDAEVGRVLQDILAKEQEFAVYEEVGVDASTTELEAKGRPAATLTLRTQATGDAVSMDKLVFAVGVDSCFGLDSETGEPLWKRNVGVNPPFAPMQVDASEKALLVYHTGVRELLLLSQKTGDLIWRLSIPARPAGRPLLFEGQIYLTTTSGEIWKISVTNGRAISKVTFNQPVVGPPAVTRDKRYMVISGDQSVVYTLSISPLKCVAVSYVEHRLGSVETPMKTLGHVLLLCDNDVSDQARLRILDIDSETGKLSVRYEDFVNGQVRDASLSLRGTNLFVPSTPQRVTAFSVHDSPDAETPLSKIGENQLENPAASPVHLLAGPGGQLWMASRELRKFHVRTNALELQPGTVAHGTHMQPIQFLNQNVYLTTNETFSSSVFFTKADPESMTGLWRTVVGTNVVAIGPTQSNESVLAIGDFGKVFRVSMSDMRSGQFVLSSISEFRIPDGLKDRVDGLALTDGRLAAYCGGESPAMWTITPSGQLEQKWRLPGVSQTQPVSLDAGVVFAVPGRLHLAGRKGGRVEDYRAPQGVNEQVTWKSLVALNGTQALAIDSKNNLIRVEYRSSPRPHLNEVSSTHVEHQIELRPTAAGDFLIAVTAAGKLLAMSSATLELLGEVDLGAQASRSPYISGNRVFVEIAGQELRTFELSGDLKQTAAVPLDHQFLVGKPVAVGDGQFVACFSGGDVLVLDADGNKTDRKLALGQAARTGPIVVGNALVVVGVDGSLYSVEDILN